MDGPMKEPEAAWVRPGPSVQDSQRSATRGTNVGIFKARMLAGFGRVRDSALAPEDPAGHQYIQDNRPDYLRGIFDAGFLRFVAFPGPGTE